MAYEYASDLFPEPPMHLERITEKSQLSPAWRKTIPTIQLSPEALQPLLSAKQIYAHTSYHRSNPPMHHSNRITFEFEPTSTPVSDAIWTDTWKDSDSSTIRKIFKQHSRVAEEEIWTSDLPKLEWARQLKKDRYMPALLVKIAFDSFDGK